MQYQTIVISHEVKQTLIPGMIGAEFIANAYQKDNGEWVVPVSDETFDRLQGLRTHRETIDNLISRLNVGSGRSAAYALDTTRRARMSW